LVEGKLHDIIIHQLVVEAIDALLDLGVDLLQLINTNLQSDDFILRETELLSYLVIILLVLVGLLQVVKYFLQNQQAILPDWVDF
jgi:hypothetical protein